MFNQDGYSMAAQAKILAYPRHPQNPPLPNPPALYTCRESSTNRPVFCKTKAMSKWAI